MIWKRTPVLLMSAAGTMFACAVFKKEQTNGKKIDKKLSADKKIAIVTGANSGIGVETAIELAERGATLVMACRDMEKCEIEREKIVLQTRNRYVYCRPCDLASFESIRSFAKLFKEEHRQLDILINNAGVMRCPKSVTQDGIETQLGVNHMGHFLLTNLLLDDLKKSTDGRIVVVASDSHKCAQINVDDLNSDKDYDPGKAYNQSKLANVLFVTELHNKLFRTNVKVNAVHPGTVSTQITRHLGVSRSFFSFLYRPFSWPFTKDARAGSQPLLHLALDPSLEKVSGKYFREYNQENISGEAGNIELARWLWTVSETWTRLKS